MVRMQPTIEKPKYLEALAKLAAEAEINPEQIKA
jgi:hypothetical protein